MFLAINADFVVDGFSVDLEAIAQQSPLQITAPSQISKPTRQTMFQNIKKLPSLFWGAKRHHVIARGMCRGLKIFSEIRSQPYPHLQR